MLNWILYLKIFKLGNKLVWPNVALQEQIESLKQELETVRARCERVEREKSDLLLRRIAALDTTSSKTAASEVW
jgi:cell division protein FtsB